MRAFRSYTHLYALLILLPCIKTQQQTNTTSEYHLCISRLHLITLCLVSCLSLSHENTESKKRSIRLWVQPHWALQMLPMLAGVRVNKQSPTPGLLPCFDIVPGPADCREPWCRLVWLAEGDAPITTSLFPITPPPLTSVIKPCCKPCGRAIKEPY